MNVFRFELTNLPARAGLGLLLVCALLVQACTGTSVNALQLDAKLPPPPANSSLPAAQSSATVPEVVTAPLSGQSTGGARKEGNFPIIGHVPTGQTEHMTKEEKNAIKAKLEPQMSDDGPEQAKRAKAAYKTELKKMKALLEYQKKRRKSQDFE